MTRKFLILAVILMCVGGYFYYTKTQKHAHSFWVAFLNIGQGDSALINFASGEQMLVDCGANRTVLAELGKQLPFWDRTIDTLLVTHPDKDHYAGCIDVLKRYTIKKIVTNGRDKPNDEEWAEFKRLAGVEGATLVTVTAPTTWTVAGDVVTFLSPDPALNFKVDSDDSNNYSIVFRLTHANKTFLFTGDAEDPLEKALLSKYCGEAAPSSVEGCGLLKSDVLKVGHHGSPGSTSDAFAGAVSPRTAVISVGKNKYGHPSERVIRHLERVGAEVLRTDMLGAIVLK